MTITLTAAVLFCVLSFIEGAAIALVTFAGLALGGLAFTAVGFLLQERP